MKYTMHKIISKIKNITNKKNSQKLLDYLAQFEDRPFDAFPKQKTFVWWASKMFLDVFSPYFQMSNYRFKIKETDLIYRWGMSKIYKTIPFLGKKKIYLLEDGFLRSVTTASDRFVPHIPLVLNSALKECV